MASKKQLVQSDILITPTISPVDAGFIGLGAKEDGLYQIKNNGTEEKLLTSADQGTGFETISNKVTAFQITPDDIHYPSEKLVKDSLDTKEDKNLVINNYYVTSLSELLDAWDKARVSTLPTTIYIAGTITLNDHIEFSGNTKQIAFIGTPTFIFDLNNRNLTIPTITIENVVFRNPNSSGYINVNGGYATIKNATFQNDSIDLSIGGIPVPHINVIGNVTNGTGKIVLDTIAHSTSSAYDNNNSLVQPILFNVKSNSSFTALYLDIKNVSSVKDFYRFSRVQIEANIETTVFVSGDETWFYAGAQSIPGTNFIDIVSILNKNTSIDNLHLGNTPKSENDAKVISIDQNNNAHIATKSIIRIPQASDIYLSSTWEDLKIDPFLGMVVSIYNDSDSKNNGLFILTSIDYTLQTSWLPVGSSGAFIGSSHNSTNVLGWIETYSGPLNKIPANFRLCDGNNGNTVNGVVIPDLRGRFLIGYDPLSNSTPSNSLGITDINGNVIENYGTIGNTGGTPSVELVGKQGVTHDHLLVNMQTGDGDNAVELTNTNYLRQGVLTHAAGDDNNAYALKAASVGTGAPTAGRSGAYIGGDPHENRPPYYVVAFVVRVALDAEYVGGSGIQTIVGGDNVTVDSTDPFNPIVNVGASGHVIQENGVDKPKEAKLNFIGATVVDNPTTQSTDVTIIIPSTSDLQPKTDNNLNTIDKTVVGAINEVNLLVKGADQALSDPDYSTAVSDILGYTFTDYNIGQPMLIVTIDVPDLWFSDKSNTFVNYTFTTDQQFINDINNNGGKLQIGNYFVSFLETAKVDLTNYVLTNDSRLSDARTPISHATSHTNGTDDIQTASGSQKGLLSASDWTTFNSKQPAGDYVPYTGANNNIDLGTNALKLAKLQLKTDATNILTTGELGWNSHDRTVDMKVDGATIQLNQEQNLTVKNTTGSTLLNGRLVRITGYDAVNDYYLVNYSDCSTESTAYVDFMLTEDITTGNVGTAIKNGIVHELNTSIGTQTNPVYLGTNGQFSAIIPAYPNKEVVVGTFGKINSTLGEILVELNKTTQYVTNNLSNRVDLKMMQNPGIDVSTPILPIDIVIDTTNLTLTIATVNGGQTITAANPVRFFTDGAGVITKWEKSSPIVFNFTNTTGIWYFHFDNTGSPIATQTPWTDFNIISSIYRFYWNATLSGSARLVVESWECHLNDISATDHAWKHAQGTIWERGLDIIHNVLTSGAPNADGRNTVISLNSGKLSDDGLEYTITNTTTPNAYFKQDMGNETSSTLTVNNSGLFKIRSNDSGGLLNILPATRFPFVWDSGTNRPMFLTTTGVPTLVTSSNFFVYYVYGLSDRGIGNAIKIASAEAQFTTLTLAQAHVWETMRNLYPTLKDNEIRPLYKLIFEYRSSYSSAVKYSALRQIDDLRTFKTTTSVASSGSTLASNVIYNPSGNVVSSNVQDAITELDTKKVAKSGDTMTGSLTATSFIKSGGTAAQFLMADGTVTNVTVYDAKYVDVAGDTMTGKLIISSGGLSVNDGTVGGTIFSVTGSTGGLFSVTDIQTGILHQVTDISGIPVYQVDSNGYCLLNSGQMIGLTTGTTALASIDKTKGSAAYIDYRVSNATTGAYRAGMVTCVWDSTNNRIQYNETATSDLYASTAGITLSMDINVVSGYVRLLTTITTGTWNVKLGLRMI